MGDRIDKEIFIGVKPVWQIESRQSFCSEKDR
jgi:hypothetical protein